MALAEPRCGVKRRLMNYSRQETHLKRETNEERKQLVLRCDSLLLRCGTKEIERASDSVIKSGFIAFSSLNDSKLKFNGDVDDAMRCEGFSLMPAKDVDDGFLLQICLRK